MLQRNRQWFSSQAAIWRDFSAGCCAQTCAGEQIFLFGTLSLGTARRGWLKALAAKAILPHALLCDTILKHLCLAQLTPCTLGHSAGTQWSPLHEDQDTQMPVLFPCRTFWWFLKKGPHWGCRVSWAAHPTPGEAQLAPRLLSERTFAVFLFLLVHKSQLLPFLSVPSL